MTARRVEIAIPLLRAVTNRANGSHGHWAPNARRSRELRELVFMTASTHRTIRATYERWVIYSKRTIPVLRASSWLAGEVTIEITRVSPRSIDGQDGLPHAFKQTVDGVADALGLKTDSDPRVSWRYAQRRGAAGENAIEIAITPRRTCPQCGQVVLEQQSKSTPNGAERASARSAR